MESSIWFLVCSLAILGMRSHVKGIISVAGYVKTSLNVFVFKGFEDLFVEVFLGDITVLFTKDLVIDGIGPGCSPEESSGCE